MFSKFPVHGWSQGGVLMKDILNNSKNEFDPQWTAIEYPPHRLQPSTKNLPNMERLYAKQPISNQNSSWIKG